MARIVPEGFYVYAYLRGEDSDFGPAGSPYYIGKGKGKRAWGKHKCGVSPPKEPSRLEIIVSGLSERLSWKIEQAFINFYGRIDQKTGCLRNKSDGGEGASGAKRSESHKQKLAFLLSQRWKRPDFRKLMASVYKSKIGVKLNVNVETKRSQYEKVSLALTGRKGTKWSSEQIARRTATRQKKGWFARDRVVGQKEII